MPTRKSLCGASTKQGGTCGNRVFSAGQRCHLHQATKAKTKIFKLCMSAVNVALATSTLYEMYQKAHPVVTPYVQALAGLLMPEHFWQAYADMNQAAMLAEYENAKGLEDRISAKYRLYSLRDRQRVEEAYVAIIAELGSLQSAA